MTGRRALIAAYHPPRLDIDSSSRRLHHIIRFLQADGWHVTAAVAAPGESEERSRPLRRLGIEVIPLRDGAAREVVEHAPFELAILAFWNLAEPLVHAFRELSPGTRVIVDSMDLQFLRRARQAFLGEGVDGAQGRLDLGWAERTARELNVYAMAHGVLTVSAKEAALVDDLVGRPGRTFWVPDCDDTTPSTVAVGARRGMVFLGNFEHPPNRDAVAWLVRDVLPLVDPGLLAAHPVRIIGSHLDPSTRALGAGVPGVNMVGWVPDVEPYLHAARASLLPLRFGAGTKRKLIQALLSRTPSVSTRIGIEGVPLTPGEHVLVADDAPGFARAIETLVCDDERWTRLADAGHALARADRGLPVARAALLHAVAAVLAPDAGSSGAPGPDAADDPPRVAPVLAAGAMEPRGEGGASMPAAILVASDGDHERVRSAGPTAWHFPRHPDGTWAGSRVADHTGAVEHLEALRACGAERLVEPAGGSRWLRASPDLRRYVDARYPSETPGRDGAVSYDLRPAPARTHPTGGPAAGRPAISVIIPTRDRAHLLRQALWSLARQSLAPDDHEVVVVDDGSSDDTAAVCAEMATQLQVRLVRIEPSGLSIAKNRGLAVAEAPLILFFDDDDLAHPDLLSEHLRAHAANPAPEMAVLGWTGWSPLLPVTPLMRFITGTGGYLFSYDRVADGALLDHTWFWGGRSSCKRAVLEHGVFNDGFTFGSEDVELGYRLAAHGLRVVYHAAARQYMNRALTTDQFAARCERQGRSQWLFSSLHADPAVRAWCGIDGAAGLWTERGPALDERWAAVRDLEAALRWGPGDRQDPGALEELYRGYWWVFDALKAKGIVEAAAHA